MFKICKIVNTNHRGYVIDIDLEEFFNKEFSNQDTIDKRVLDSNKRLHYEKFKEYIDKILDYILLKDAVQSILIKKPAKNELEKQINILYIYSINSE